MFLTKKGKFSYELVLEALNSLLHDIKIIANDFNQKDIVLEIQHQDGSGKNTYLRPDDFPYLPLKGLLEEENKQIVKQILYDFSKGNKIENYASIDFVYDEFIKLLGSQDFYSKDVIDLHLSISLFENLKALVHEEISSTKLIIIPVVGVFIEKGQKCVIGSVEFINKSDFLKQCILFKKIDNNNDHELDDEFKSFCQQSDLIAQVNIKNRDSFLAKNTASEIIKRVYTLIRLILSRIGYKHCFLGTLGEKYLEPRTSFLMKINNSKNITGFETNTTINHFKDREINLLEIISLYQNNADKIWFSQCESIISKYVNEEKMTNFEKRIWTALYWLGETMTEQEISSLIIKYATCLETLFNTREGGISEQISEFTAFICGYSKEERLYIYDNIKKLYKLRSTIVHGGGNEISRDEAFFHTIQSICEQAVILMSYHSCQEPWLNSKGYHNFIRYMLREYRFSNSE
ncbi:MAG: hypothetical protein AB4063_16130 [Crocosphaera sp.]